MCVYLCVGGVCVQRGECVRVYEDVCKCVFLGVQVYAYVYIFNNVLKSGHSEIPMLTVISIRALFSMVV